MNDGILHISLFDGQARAVAALTTNTVAQAQRLHGTAATATAALGRALTATAMLSSLLKGEKDSITATIRGDGPLGAVVCVGESDHTVRGYVDNPLTELPLSPFGKLDVGGAVGHNGFLTVIKDLGMKEPYVGRTQLVSGEIGEDFAQYLLISEQQPSLVALGVLCSSKEVLGAGGVLIQPMPGCSEEVLSAIEEHSPHLAKLSHLCQEATDTRQLAQITLGDLPYKPLEEFPISFACHCDRNRLEKVLLSLGEDELNDMIREQNGAQLTCHFCNSVYDFTGDELQALLAEGKA